MGFNVYFLMFGAQIRRENLEYDKHLHFLSQPRGPKSRGKGLLDLKLAPTELCKGKTTWESYWESCCYSL